MYCKLATASAEWWIQTMLKKCHALKPDDVSGCGFNFVIVNVCLAEKFSIFRNLLITEIESHLKIYRYFTMGCCYYPDNTLTKLAKKAGISLAYFPVHAHLEIVNNTIMVSTDTFELYKLNVSLE